MRERQGPHFINVDLEVWSHEDLAAFSRAVESRRLVLYVAEEVRPGALRDAAQPGTP